MRVNHLHLMVPDVPAACVFFEKDFELRKVRGNSTATYPQNFHFGFFLDSEAKVNAIHGRMAADGLPVAAPAREHSYSFYVDTPGGFLVEVGA